MKKVLICAILALLVGQVHSQNNELLSIQIEAGYHHDYNLKSSNFHFNYQLSPLVFVHFNKFRIGSGVNFITKNGDEYDISYLNVPILVSFDIYSKNSNRFNIIAGVSFDNLVKFKDKTTNEDILQTDKPNKELGMSLLLSIYYHRQLSRMFNVFVSPFAEFKVRNELGANPHYNWSYPQSGFAFGLKIGFEFGLK